MSVLVKRTVIIITPEQAEATRVPGKLERCVVLLPLNFFSSCH